MLRSFSRDIPDVLFFRYNGKISDRKSSMSEGSSIYLTFLQDPSLFQNSSAVQLRRKPPGRVHQHSPTQAPRQLSTWESCRTANAVPFFGGPGKFGPAKNITNNTKHNKKHWWGVDPPLGSRRKAVKSGSQEISDISTQHTRNSKRWTNISCSNTAVFVPWLSIWSPYLCRWDMHMISLNH